MDHRIESLAEDLLAHLLEADPLEASLLGYREYDARLADLSPAVENRLEQQRAALRQRAEDIDPAGLTGQDRITRDVIISLTRGMDEHSQAKAVTYTVSAFPVAPLSVLLAYLRMVAVTNARQATDFELRLGEIPGYLEQALSRLAEGRAQGRTPVASLVRKAIEQIDEFTLAPAAALTPQADGWDGAQEWLRNLELVLVSTVVPAARAYREALADEVLPTARPDEKCGLVHLPRGDEMYAGLVRAHTTTRRSPQELHEQGLAIVANVHDEFRQLGREVFGTQDLPEIFQRMANDPQLRWQESEQILSAVRDVVQRAESVAPEWFGTVPSIACAVAAIPEIEAKSSGMAYYMPAALDGSRPGTYFQNVSDPTSRRQFDLESVVFHEAVPGHHFQIQLALELADLPVIRRLTMFTAYAEGWGLYAERLADEMGLYSSPTMRLGMLAADAWRAARLVVDTGMHAFGWSRQQAVDYLLANTPEAADVIEMEVDRYIAYPAQALSYMTGRLEIQRLRAQAQQRADFDLRTFHDAVLGSGALPLDVLAEVVDAVI